MSNKEALDIFMRKHVTTEMVECLVSTTQSIIKVKTPEDNATTYPSPPSSPDHCHSSTSKSKKPVSLKSFIINLIRYSNVQVPTLMATLVYLNRLKEILPSDQIYGIATTHHRIFVGCLILTAKYVNDSSPLNKHWALYSSGLLSVKELNVIEVEVLSYLDWDLGITNDDLYGSLATFLAPIKNKLKVKREEEKILKRHEQQQQQQFKFSKPGFKPLKHSSSISSIKEMLCPPSASSVSFSDSLFSISPTSSSFLSHSLSHSLSNNSSMSSLSSSLKNPQLSKPENTNYSIPSLTNSAPTYQSNSNSSSSYSFNNSSTSSITKRMIEEDFNFVAPPAKAAGSDNGGSYSLLAAIDVNPASIFSSPKNLLARITSRANSPKRNGDARANNTALPQLYHISSNSSLRSTSCTSKLMSPINSFKSKMFKKNATLTGSKLQNPQTSTSDEEEESNSPEELDVHTDGRICSNDIAAVKCLAQPPNIRKNQKIKVSISSDNLKHFNMNPPIRLVNA